MCGLQNVRLLYHWTERITYLILSKYFYVSYVMLYMPVTCFYSPKIFLCKAELSKDFDYVVLSAPNSAAKSRPWERGTSLGKKTGDPCIAIA